MVSQMVGYLHQCQYIPVSQTRIEPSPRLKC